MKAFSIQIFLLVMAISVILFSFLNSHTPTPHRGYLQITSPSQSRLYIPDIYNLGPTHTPSPSPTRKPSPTVTPLLPDLYIYDFDLVYYEDCPWGSPGLVALYIINKGVRDSGEFTVQLWDKFSLVEGLKVQATIDVSTEFKAGPMSSIYGVADVYNQVAESDESNNILSVIYTPPPPCDPTTTPTPLKIGD